MNVRLRDATREPSPGFWRADPVRKSKSDLEPEGCGTPLVAQRLPIRLTHISSNTPVTQTYQELSLGCRTLRASFDTLRVRMEVSATQQLLKRGSERNGQVEGP